MNIFFLSYEIQKCAKYHCDKHVVKMILEIVQLLYTAHHMNGSSVENAPLSKSGRNGYPKTHHNHPMAIWVRETIKNYKFTVKLGLKLCQEYTFRYKKVHACENHLLWLQENIPSFSPVEYKATTVRKPYIKGLSDVPLCISDPKYHRDDAVRSYRAYYNGDKKSFAKWKNREIPYWFFS